MRMGDAIKLAMKETNTTQARLAERLSRDGNRYTQQVIQRRLGMENISVNLVLEMLDQLDYELVVQPKRRGRRPDGQVVIGGDDE